MGAVRGMLARVLGLLRIVVDDSLILVTAVSVECVAH